MNKKTVQVNTRQHGERTFVCDDETWVLIDDDQFDYYVNNGSKKKIKKMYSEILSSLDDSEIREFLTRYHVVKLVDMSSVIVDVLNGEK